MLNLKKKEKIIKEHKKHATDTGSPEIQIGLFSNQIKELLSHLKKHPKDLHSKKGLLKMVSKRRKFLKFLKDKSARRYNAIIKKVGLKK
jgi:small subunit ribosomal protein S15